MVGLTKHIRKWQMLHKGLVGKLKMHLDLKVTPKAVVRNICLKMWRGTDN